MRTDPARATGGGLLGHQFGRRTETGLELVDGARVNLERRRQSFGRAERDLWPAALLDARDGALAHAAQLRQLDLREHPVQADRPQARHGRAFYHRINPTSSCEQQCITAASLVGHTCVSLPYPVEYIYVIS
jgi:hypothetical protein